MVSWRSPACWRSLSSLFHPALGPGGDKDYDGGDLYLPIIMRNGGGPDSDLDGVPDG
jgi:hypothetical protein